MPRPERELDPDGGPVESLAAALRDLRRAAGNPGYRELAARCGFSMTVLANAAGGRRLPSLAVTLGFVRACGDDPVTWERRWREAAAESAALRGTSERVGEADAAPYLGLMAYDVADAGLFFGRDQLVAQLVQTLQRRRFVAVFGASGSGKSSLLKAGLIPATARARADGDGGLPTALAAGSAAVLLTPGADPVGALRRALDAPGRLPLDGLLVVDQFEELFTLCRDPAQRTRFVDELVALAEDQATALRVVIGVRADFFERCAELPPLARLLAEASVPVGPLSERELHQVVTEPARRAGLSVERALMTRILTDAAGQPGALPLLSHALLETWRQRRGEVLTSAGYEATGGMTTAIARTAESVYQRCPAGRRDSTRWVMTRLVTVGDGVHDTRRRVERRELDFPEVDLVLRELADARLVVLGQDTVEIAHEALIAAWPRLRVWLNADRETLRLHRQLTEDTRVWSALDRDADALYRGARLAAWDGRETDGLNPAECAFLTASRQRAADEVAGRRRRTRLAVAALGLAAGLVGALAAVAVVQADRASAERGQTLSRKLMSEAVSQRQQDPLRALTLARRAYDAWPSAEPELMLRQTVADNLARGSVTGHEGHATGVAFSPDGRLMASTGTDDTVRVWPRTGGADATVLRGFTDDGWSPVFSPDGRRLAAAGRDGTIRVWSADGPGTALVFRGHVGGVSSVAFSPDGKSLASAGDDGTTRIWPADGAGPPTVLRDHTGRVWGVAFSRDGRWLATSGYTDRTVQLRDLTGQGAPIVLRGHDDVVKSLAFSPDGTRLASASQDGTARVWSVGGSDPPVVLRGHQGSVEAVAFSPDGTWLATTSDDGTVRVWNPTGAEPVAHRDPLVLRGHRGTVWAVAFSPDGTELASAGEDGTIRRWDPRGPGDPVLLRGHTGAAWTVATSADGRHLASGGEDGTVRIWDLDRPAAAQVLRGHDGDVLGLSVSRDGGRVASAGHDRTVRIWNTDGSGEPVVLRGHQGTVWMASLSPDGRRVATASADGTLGVWDAGGASPPLIRPADQVQIRYAAFSPDGHRVATAGADGTVRVWGADGGTEPLVLRGHQGLVWAVAFSADGRRLASAGSDGTVRIWSLDGNRRPVVLTGHRGFAWHLAFSPDGAWLASTGHDDTVRIWRTDQPGQPVTYSGFVASAEQVAFTADGRLVTAHGDGTVRVWRCTACAPVRQIRAIVAAAG